MKTACLLIVLIFSFLIQTRLSVFGISPALTVAVVYYLGIRSSPSKGIFLGSLIGVIEDSISGGILGPNLLAKGMVGYFSSFISGILFRWTPLLGIMSLFILTVIDGLIVSLSRAIYETMPAAPYVIIYTILLRGLINSIIGVFIKPKNAD